ncbi:MAG: 30S ribosomal protein S6 [bacterium]|nr:30S ribosomal protein S6 [bacterium]
MAVAYETIFVLDPSLNEDAVNKIGAKIAGFIQEQEGQINQQEIWGKQKLTYSIRKKNEGIYLYFNYSAPPAMNEEMRLFLKYEEAILRSMTTKVKVVRRSRFTKKQAKEERHLEVSESSGASLVEEVDAHG